LKLWHEFRVSDETWGAICDSLKTHPTLEVLDLRVTKFDATAARAVLNSRIQALKMSVSMHTIYLNLRYSRHELLLQSVIPYLETNRLRPRLLALQKARPITYRAQVLGRERFCLLVPMQIAFGCCYQEMWKLLFHREPRRSRRLQPSLRLRQRSAAAPCTANIAVVAASVMLAAWTTTCTNSLPPAAASAATLQALPLLLLRMSRLPFALTYKSRAVLVI
jgi:hypothetical protein